LNAASVVNDCQKRWIAKTLESSSESGLGNLHKPREPIPNVYNPLKVKALLAPTSSSSQAAIQPEFSSKQGMMEAVLLLLPVRFRCIESIPQA
jgi:hypothetical protein